MKIKAGANLAGMDLRIRPALIAADAAFKLAESELIVTAGLDGVHSAGSLHYYGLAFDCRTRHLNEGGDMSVSSEIRANLPYVFDVVLEHNHIHIEYDPDKES